MAYHLYYANDERWLSVLNVSSRSVPSRHVTSALDCVTLRAPSFLMMYEEGTRFLKGLPFRLPCDIRTTVREDDNRSFRDVASHRALHVAQFLPTLLFISVYQVEVVIVSISRKSSLIARKWKNDRGEESRLVSRNTSERVGEPRAPSSSYLRQTNIQGDFIG